jgi:hypothetical protein
MPVGSIMSKRRRLKRIFLGFLVLIMLSATIYSVAREVRYARNERMLAEAIAETDSIDPFWHVEDLDKGRQRDTGDPKSYQRIMDVAETTDEWMTVPLRPEPLAGQSSRDFFDCDEPNCLLRDEELRIVEEFLAKHSKTLDAARLLADLPQGYRRAAMSDIKVDRLLQNVCRLLAFDVLGRAQTGDFDGSLQSLRASLRVSSSLVNERFLYDHIIRMRTNHLIAIQLERLLALSEPSEALKKLPYLLTVATGGDTVLADGVREWRAGAHAEFKQIEGMRITPFDAFDGELRTYRDRPDVPRDHAMVLRWYNNVLKISRLPLHEQAAAFEAIEYPMLSDARRFGLMSYLSPLKATQQHQAAMDCARVAIAVELFRVERGHWPESLAELPRTLLPDIPLDPFDGRQLRFRRTDYGVVVYSIGPNGIDDGGAIEGKRWLANSTHDLGFRLWDPDRRKQPPP